MREPDCCSDVLSSMNYLSSVANEVVVFSWLLFERARRSLFTFFF